MGVNHSDLLIFGQLFVFFVSSFIETCKTFSRSKNGEIEPTISLQTYLVSVLRRLFAFRCQKIWRDHQPAWRCYCHKLPFGKANNKTLLVHYYPSEYPEKWHTFRQQFRTQSGPPFLRVERPIPSPRVLHIQHSVGWTTQQQERWCWVDLGLKEVFMFWGSEIWRFRKYHKLSNQLKTATRFGSLFKGYVYIYIQPEFGWFNSIFFGRNIPKRFMFKG